MKTAIVVEGIVNGVVYIRAVNMDSKTEPMRVAPGELLVFDAIEWVESQNA